VLLFVVLADGVALDDELKARLNRALQVELSPRYVPDQIVAVPAIARTLTGKKLELPVKKLLLGAPVDQVASPGATLDPHALDHFVSLAQAGRWPAGRSVAGGLSGSLLILRLTAPGVLARAAWRQMLGVEVAQHAGWKGDLAGRGPLGGRNGPSQDAQHADEAQPVGVGAVLQGGLMHEGAAVAGAAGPARVGHQVPGSAESAGTRRQMGFAPTQNGSQTVHWHAKSDRRMHRSTERFSQRSSAA
jgi:hypothetical protein